MQIRIVFLVILLVHLLSSNVLIAQTITFSGQVTETGSDLPLIGATVKLGSKGTVTDFEGNFEISTEAGSYELSISYLGYRDHMDTLNLVTDIFQKINLAPTDNILEVTTITGSKYEKNLSESPISINVIKPRLIQNTNMNKMDKLLDRIPGVQIIDGQVNIRGGSGYSYGAGSRVLLLIDDVPAFQADAGRPLWDDIPVENISQVEVLKGASSALYGSAALNGIINIRTGYATSKPKTTVFTSYTTYDDPVDERKKWEGYDPRSINIGATHKRKFKKLDMVLAGFVEDFDGFYEETFKNRYRLSGNFKYRITPKLTLGVNTMYNYKDDRSFLLWNNARGGAYQGWDRTATAGTTKRFYIDPQLNYTSSNGDTHKLLSRYYWLQNGSSTQQATTSDNYFLEYQYLKNLTKYGLKLVAGGSGYFVNSNSQLYGDTELNSKNLAAFLQLEKKLFKGMNLTVGSRIEQNLQSNPGVFLGDTLGDIIENEAKVVSRLGLNYKVTPVTYARASIGQGYRFPTIAERFIYTNLGSLIILPNPGLESETGWTVELGLRQLLPIGKSGGFLDIAVFKSRYNNMMEFVFGQYGGEIGFQSQNVGDISITGFEANVAGDVRVGPANVKLLAGYTFIEPKYLEISPEFESTISRPIVTGEDEKFLKYRNRHNYKADIELEIWGLSLGYTVNYTSPLVTMDQFLENLKEINQYRALNNQGSRKMDARISYRYRNFKLSGLVENLTNLEYMVRPGLLEAPRNFSLRLDIEL